MERQANEIALVAVAHHMLRYYVRHTTKGMIKWPFCNDVETVCIHNKSQFFDVFLSVLLPAPGMKWKRKKKKYYYTLCVFACATIFSWVFCCFYRSRFSSFQNFKLMSRVCARRRTDGMRSAVFFMWWKKMVIKIWQPTNEIGFRKGS